MSEAPTPSSTTLAVIPLDDNKTSKVLAENKSSSPPTDSNSNSNSPQESPPSDEQTPPSPNSSSGNESPSPPDNSSPSSPPTTGSNTPSSDSPPPDSNSSPPSDSGSSPSPPPPSDNSNSNSNSDSSPPPPDSDSSNSSPPPDKQSSPPPPPPSDSNSPPPKGDTPKGDTPSPPAPPPDSTVAKPPPNDQSSSPSPDKSSSPPKSPPKESSPPPTTESKASPPAPTQPLAPLPKTPVTPNSPPQSHDSPPAPTSDSRSPPADSTPYVPTPPGSKASQHVPGVIPSSTRSDSSSSTPPSSSSGTSTGGVAGATLAGLVIIAFVAIFFVVARKKKKRANAYPGYFGPPPPNYSGGPPNYSGSADGYYYAQHSQQHSLPHSQQHAIGIAGQSNEFYSGPSTMGNGGHGSYRAPESGVIAGGLSCFSYEELMGITSGFARQNVIGEGGFGSVYKGFLADGRAVAVKELKAGSGQGEREFRAEVEIISRVHHRHLVSLVGYCIADSHRLLVYEFVSNNTLEHHLHGEGVTVMEWSKRMKIAVGSARGLAYLHEDCHPKIIHRDIKSANILIDDDYEAQVADFGLAKLSDDISAHVSTRVMGTFGYLAPEYAASGKLSDKSDVFSFGVVLLEIVTGRKPVDGSQPLGDESLVEWARPLLAHALETGDFSELVDPRLGNRYVEDEMLRMISAASASVRHSAPKRPRMVQVLRALDTEGDMPDLTNGVKVGQSTIFQAGQNVSDMQKFRMMAFGSEDSSEYQMQSSEYKMQSSEFKMQTGNFTSGEAPRRPRPGDTGAVEFSSGELETRAINPRSNRRL